MQVKDTSRVFQTAVASIPKADSLLLNAHWRPKVSDVWGNIVYLSMSTVSYKHSMHRPFMDNLCASLVCHLPHNWQCCSCMCR